MRRFILVLLVLGLAACQGAAPTPTPTPTPTPSPPTELSVELAATPTDGTGPLEVTFTATAAAYTPDYLWDFGDGTESFMGEADQVHTYQEPGTYTATVTIGNSEDNAADIAQITVR